LAATPGKGTPKAACRSAQEGPQPSNPFALDHVITAQHLLHAVNCRTVATDHNGRRWGYFPRQPRHFFSLDKVGRYERNAHHVVAFFQLLHKPLSAGKIQNGHNCLDVGSQEIQPEGSMLKAPGAHLLGFGNLIVKKLHYVFFPSVCIVNTKGAEDTGKQHPLGAFILNSKFGHFYSSKRPEKPQPSPTLMS
jgi:hypothetical protein